MRINNNMMAMNTHRQLGAANAGGAKSMEKLSSGLRINRAGDDAAGLSISEKMRGQIRGLNQASANAQDGISMIQTAEGALNETHAILQRMRELSVQSASDTNVDVLDRESIQTEYKQLQEEIDRIGDTTEFNTQKLIDGSVGAKKLAGSANAAVIGDAVGKETAAVAEGNAATGTGLDDVKITELDLKIDGANIKVTLDGEAYKAFDDGANVNTKDMATKMQADINKAIADYNTANDTKIADVTVTEDGTSGKDGILSIKSGSVGATSTISINANTTTENLKMTAGAVATNNISGTGKEGVYTAGGAGAVAAVKTLAGDDAKTTFTIDGKEIAIDFSSGGTDPVGVATNNLQGVTAAAKDADMKDIGDALALDLNAAIKNYNATVPTSEQVKDVTVSVKDGAFVVESGSEEATSSVKFDNSQASQLLGLAKQSSSTQGGGVDFQIGANTGQHMKVTIEDMRADALGIAEVDLSTKEGARAAMDTINDAINKVSNQRSNLGAFQNRLEHTIKNLDNSAENLQAAEARIRDVDMAKEMMEQTKQNILAQASTAMLANANQAPQAVLQLLR